VKVVVIDARPSSGNPFRLTGNRCQRGALLTGDELLQYPHVNALGSELGVGAWNGMSPSGAFLCTTQHYLLCVTDTNTVHQFNETLHPLTSLSQGGPLANFGFVAVFRYSWTPRLCKRLCKSKAQFGLFLHSLVDREA